MRESLDTNMVNADTDPLFKLLVESVRDYAIFLLDEHGNVRTWNEGARRIKGYEASEIIGRHFSTFYPQHEIDAGKPDSELVTAARDGRWEEEGWRLRKDGSRFWASVVITALYDSAHHLVGFAKVTRDLTERKRAEEQREVLLEMERRARSEAETALTELRAIHSLTEAALAHLTVPKLLDELLARVRDILEVDTVVVLLMNDDDNVLLPVAAQGIDEERIVGFPIPVGAGFAGRVAAERRPIEINDVATSNVMSPFVRDQGIKSLLGVPLLTEARLVGVLHVGTLQPRQFHETEKQLLQIVSDRIAAAIDRVRLMEAEQEARLEAEMAETRLRTQDAFLETAAHELRSPAASVKAAAQLLMRRSVADPKIDEREWLPFLEIADQEADRLTRLVDKLIESVRVGAQRPGLELAYVDTAALLRRAVELARVHAGERQVSITAPDELWAWVDPLGFEEIVSNLLENAIKYGGDEPVEVNLGTTDDTMLCLDVRDYGTGIALDRRSRLFERFYRATDSSGRHGLGLGLYICREIAKQHGGEIEAEHPPEGGMRFVVKLPLEPRGQDRVLSFLPATSADEP